MLTSESYKIVVDAKCQSHMSFMYVSCTTCIKWARNDEGESIPMCVFVKLSIANVDHIKFASHSEFWSMSVRYISNFI